MKIFKTLIILGCISFIASCGGNPEKKAANEGPIQIVQKVDNAVKQLELETKNLKKITTLDHHRMAKEVGVYTPPSIATIVSNPEIDIALIQESQLIGLDLPFKFLCYAEPDTLNVKIGFTSAEFIQKRHDLDAALLANYDTSINKILKSFPKEMVSMTNVSDVDKGFGIVKIKSDFDFSTTLKNLKGIVMSQGDTKWFADIDYQKDASAFGIAVRPTTLLLFGAPAPGGKAMITSPKIGLDAFCQKLLVYENEIGEVWIAYNDIVAFAELYYETSTKPQQLINKRLKMTFSKALTKQVNE